MKAWLKGGLILGGTVALIIILNFVYCIGKEPEFCTAFVLILSIPILFIVNFVQDISIIPGYLRFIIYFILIILTYFLIGVFIGWIIGKIKSRNSSPIK